MESIFLLSLTLKTLYSCLGARRDFLGGDIADEEEDVLFSGAKTIKSEEGSVRDSLRGLVLEGFEGRFMLRGGVALEGFLLRG